MAEQPSLHASREEWMVFADALQQAGDPRGELITWNDKIEAGAKGAAESRDVYLREHAAAILGEAGGRLADYDLTWRFGLLSRASVRLGEGANAVALVRDLLASKVAGQLETLALVGVPKGDQARIDLSKAVETAMAALPASCTHLELIDQRAAERSVLTATYYDPGPNLVSFGPLASVFASHVERLRIVTADPFQIEFGDIDAPNLRELVLDAMRYAAAYDTGTELTQTLSSANWPKLEVLELRLAETYNASIAYSDDAYVHVYDEERLDEYGDDEWAEGTDWNEELTPLLTALRPLPLKRLALRGADSTGTLLDALEQNPLPVTLDELDLSDCQFSAAEARWMSERSSLFDTLKRLRLERVGFTDESLKQLENLTCEVIHTAGRPRNYRFVVGSE